jgi:3-oxoacyl-[acyl-carrier-protein] synthase III
MRSRVIGTGSYVPERVVTNAELGRALGVSDSWIVERTGIRERRYAAPGETTSHMAVKASRRALESAGIRADELDLIIVATVTGDAPTPATATFLQAQLGARKAFAFDLSAACTGALYALSVADQYLRSGTARRALVVGAELMSRLLDDRDRNTSIIFGDAAGALVLEAVEKREAGLLSTHLFADGDHAEILWVPAPGSRTPASPEVLERRLDRLQMNGREVFRSAVRYLVQAAERALEANGVKAEQVRHVVAHQANLRILQAVADRLGIPMERVFINLDRYGNTSAAAIPMGLDELRRAGRLAAGELVLALAVGAGLTWGSALLKWH